MERLELAEFNERYPVQQEPAQQKEYAQAVDHTVDETGAGGRRKIFGRNRHLLDPEAQMSCLDEHFLIEDEAIGVERKRNLFERPPAISTIAGMVFSQAQAQGPVFQLGQKPVTNVFPPGHALLECVSRQKSGT